MIVSVALGVILVVIQCSSQELYSRATSAQKAVISQLSDADSLLKRAETEERVDLDFDPADFENYLDLCYVGTNNDVKSIGEVYRRVSEQCSEDPIDEGEECQQGNVQAMDRYGFNEATQKCETFEYLGCGGNDNRYEDLRECQWTCEDPCNQPVDRGLSVDEVEEGEECTRSVEFYYDKDSNKCDRFRFSGCGGNKNRFETERECVATCNARPSVRPNASIAPGLATFRPASLTLRTARPTPRVTLRTVTPMFTVPRVGIPTGRPVGRFSDVVINRGKRQTEREAVRTRGRVPNGLMAADTMDRVDSSKGLSAQGQREAGIFCRNFTTQYPDLVQLVSSLDTTQSQDVESAIAVELDEQLTRVDQRTSVLRDSEEFAEIRRKRQILSFIRRPLRWARVVKVNNGNCREYRVTIRIFCMSAIFNGPNASQRNMLCDLMKAGIKKHWEVPIVENGITWPVRITVKNTWFLSKKVVLKYYTSPASNERSFNPFPALPMWMKYRAYSNDWDRNLRFMETAAHELGHDVANAIGGLVYSWTHEGSTFIWQTVKPSTPVLPDDPAPINLMWYYNDGGDTTNYYDRVRATQAQVKGLVSLATIRYTIWWCPGALGSPCISGSQCNSGICSWFRCVACNTDSQCSSNQYCKGRFNPVVVNHCSSKKSNGKLCTRNAMCASGMCDGGQCVECKNDGDCPNGDYCKWNNVPLVLNQCKDKKPNGAYCLQNRECASGMCDGAQCVECDSDNDCPSGQWCKYKNIPLVLNDCVSKLGNGGWCSHDNQCASGHCDGARCAECEEDHHCLAHQYCKNKDIPLVVNRCASKKCTGLCNRDRMCKSGKCRAIFFCKKC